MLLPTSPPAQDLRLLDQSGLARLLDLLRDEEGYRLIGPVAHEDGIVPEPIGGGADLPRGGGAEQAPGRYRLRERGDERRFGWGATARSWKRELFPARLELVQISRRGGVVEARDARPPAPRLALVGVRPCDVAAIAVQDRVLAGGPYPDADYLARRNAAFIVAVSCTEPTSTCFCAGMGTGPRARDGHDLALTEVGDPPRYLVEAGSERGARVLARLGAPAAPAADVAAADAAIEAAAARMRPAPPLREQATRLEHPRWAEVAARCLGCASCTLACPTCFCTNIEESSDLTGEEATRTRTWDSCFTSDFAYVHGGSVRPSLRARYRQWLLHKLAFWEDQFDVSGCVGCGRCIAWCPAGIDLAAEATAVAGER